MTSVDENSSPDETEIEGMLSRIKPQPTARFSRMMKPAPWNRVPVKNVPSYRASMSERNVTWVLVTLIVMTLTGAILFIPSVKAVANQIFHSFLHAPSNQIQVQVTVTSPGDLYSYSDPGNFQLSVAQAEQKAGYQVKQVLPIPAGFVFEGARYDNAYNTVILLYQDPASYLTLWLTQRPLKHSQDVFSIGPEATVRLVKIGEIQGEFVQGGWQVRSTQTATETQPAGNSVNVVAVWDNSLPQSTLRWQAEGMAYELRVSGFGGPSQSDLINWANELK